jgi:chemotaxis protein CheX
MTIKQSSLTDAPECQPQAGFGTSATLRLPEILDFAAAAPLAQALLAHRSAPAVIDAAAARQLGAQCLQVLLSAAQTWRSDAVALTMVNVSAEVVEQISAFGIDPAILVGGELSQ